MNERVLPTRRDRLLQIAYLLAAHERATPLARRVLECRLCLIESELKSAPEDEVTSPEGVVSDKITSLQLTRALSAAE